MSQEKYIVCDKSDVYHIHVSKEDGEWDMTLCGYGLVYKMGVPIFLYYRNGFPIPELLDAPPIGKRLCHHCQRKLSACVQ